MGALAGGPVAPLRAARLHVPKPGVTTSEHDELYLFWRGQDWSADFTTRSTTGHWGRVHRLIADHGQRPYVKIDSNGRDTIDFAYTNGHPRETLTSVYYVNYHHGALWTAGGRRIRSLARAPISPQQGQLVYDGSKTKVSAWVWDVALGSTGQPVIVYATFPKPTTHRTGTRAGTAPGGCPISSPTAARRSALARSNSSTPAGSRSTTLTRRPCSCLGGSTGASKSNGGRPPITATPGSTASWPPTAPTTSVPSCPEAGLTGQRASSGSEAATGATRPTGRRSPTCAELPATFLACQWVPTLRGHDLRRDPAHIH